MIPGNGLDEGDAFPPVRRRLEPLREGDLLVIKLFAVDFPLPHHLKKPPEHLLVRRRHYLAAVNLPRVVGGI